MANDRVDEGFDDGVDERLNDRFGKEVDDGGDERIDDEIEKEVDPASSSDGAGSGLYEYPYPSPELAREHPFVELNFTRRSFEDQRRRADELYQTFSKRRSIRMFSDDPVPQDLVDRAIEIASSAPSGAHKQPWTFVAVSSAALKSEIRRAAEAEERVNYLENRMNAEWQEAIASLGTDWHKEFLEVAPWLVVLFEQRYELLDNGAQRKNYYVKESCGIAAGFFIAALHSMGLATLTHTPSPMTFLAKVLQRPKNERAFMLFPVGYPLDTTLVPDLRRKSLDEVRVLHTDSPNESADI